jgi:hypothetical protein
LDRDAAPRRESNLQNHEGDGDLPEKAPRLHSYLGKEKLMTKAKAKEQPALFEQEQKPPVQINEGSVKKNTNPPPTTERPAAPKSQVAPKKPGTAVAKAERRGALTDEGADEVSVLLRVVENDPAKAQMVEAMLERARARRAKIYYDKAYNALQEDLPIINKDNKIVIEKGGRVIQSTPYASYDNMQIITRPILHKHDFTLEHTTEPGKDGIGIIVISTLSYSHGLDYRHTKTATLPLKIENSGSKNDIQGVNSSISYGKRINTNTLLDLISQAPDEKDRDGHPKTKRGARVEASAEHVDGMQEEMDDDGVQKINGSQEKQLLAEIAACGVASETFLKFWKITAVKDLPLIDFDQAIQACKNYAAKHPKN